MEGGVKYVRNLMFRPRLAVESWAALNAALLLVTMIGDPSRWSLSGSSATLSSSRMAPQSPPESRRGFHPSMGVGSGSRWASGRVP